MADALSWDNVWGVAKMGRREVATVIACDHQGTPGWCPALNFKDACIPHHDMPQEVALASMRAPGSCTGINVA